MVSAGIEGRPAMGTCGELRLLISTLAFRRLAIKRPPSLELAALWIAQESQLFSLLARFHDMNSPIVEPVPEEADAGAL